MRLHRTSTRYYTYAVVLRITTEFYVRSIPAQFFFMKFVAKSVTSMVCTLGLSKPCVNATFVLFEEKAGIGWFTMVYDFIQTSGDFVSLPGKTPIGFASTGLQWIRP